MRTSIKTLLLALLGLFGAGMMAMAQKRPGWKREDEGAFRMSEEVRGRANMTAFLAQAMRSTREELAELAHDAWSAWVEETLSQGVFDRDGTVILPADLVLDWQRLRATAYQELSEREKRDARGMADRVIALWCEVPFDFEKDGA